MPTISVTLEGDNAWKDLAKKPLEILHIQDECWYLTALPGGMVSGKTSLALRINIPKGSIENPSVMVTETSLEAWIAATCLLRGKYPEAFKGTPLEEK